MSRSEQLISKFAGCKVLVVGDVVADQYLDGTITRVSREAPVFILRHDETCTFPGAAANAAANVSALGATPILIGIVGDDESGRALRGALDAANVGTENLVVSSGARTTTKVRVLGGQPHAARQQVIRIDYECERPVQEVENVLLERIYAEVANADAVIVSDYGYGVVSDTVFEEIKRLAGERHIPVILDSRFRFGDFVGATSATPNQEEVEAVLGRGFTDDDCESLRSRLGLKSLLVTNGSKGMSLFEEGRSVFHLDVVGSPSAVDVTGAGDTVIATFALALAASADTREAAVIANHAGGIVVMKKGTATANAAELNNSIQNHAQSIQTVSNG